MELTKIEQLEQIESNINTCRKRIMGFQDDLKKYAIEPSSVMILYMHGTENHLHQIDITQKCLEYWQRRHLRHLNRYPSINRLTTLIEQIGNKLQSSANLSTIETAWLTEIQTLTNLK